MGEEKRKRMKLSHFIVSSSALQAGLRNSDDPIDFPLQCQRTFDYCLEQCQSSMYILLCENKCKEEVKQCMFSCGERNIRNETDLIMAIPEYLSKAYIMNEDGISKKAILTGPSD